MTRERLAAREHAASAFPAASGRARVRVYQTVSKPRLTGIGIEIGPGRGADTHFAVAPVSHDGGGRLPAAWIGRPQLRRGNRVRAGVERQLHRPKPELRRGMEDASPLGA
jgi:hypothetical protein